jgi:hypothetical protein
MVYIYNIVIKRYRFFNSTQRLQHFSIHYWNTIQIFIQLKDICYEVKTGFLPDNAIVEMVTNVNEDISQDNIVKRYNALKCALPEKWTRYISITL